MVSTNLNRLENWLGHMEVARLQHNMRGWYGPPIAVGGVPGEVFIRHDGDFIGECREGYYFTAWDRARETIKRLQRGARIATSPRRSILHAGAASLSDLISEATSAQKRLEMTFSKVGPTGVSAVTSTLWRVGNLPQAGGSSTAPAGGRVCTSSTTGAMNSLVNATTFNSGDFLNIVCANVVGTVVGQLLLYDRLFDVAKTMNSTATEAVTGTITRYTSTTTTDPDYIGGNFGFIEVGGTALAATAHNWTTCKYTNDTGTTSTLPSVAGTASAITDRLDQPTNQWFAPLAAGDIGIKNWTQLQCSANVASGIINFCIGHPLLWMPCPIASQMCTIDGINTAFNLVRIFDNACLAFLDVNKTVTTATTYSGNIICVSS